MGDLDPRTALVLLWHWSQTPSPAVPAWCRKHPAWPRNFDPADCSKGHLRRAALPLLQQMEREIATPAPARDA